jgi:hypothetical protein
MNADELEGRDYSGMLLTAIERQRRPFDVKFILSAQLFAIK